jgi:hypothetical protein
MTAVAFLLIFLTSPEVSWTWAKCEPFAPAEDDATILADDPADLHRVALDCGLNAMQ